MTDPAAGEDLDVSGPGQLDGKKSPAFPRPRRWAVVAAAAGAGIGAGLLGTSLHGHAWFPDGPESAIPYGSALALLLLAAVSTFVGLWSRSAWVVVWCGAAAYLTAGVLSLQLGSFGMIFDNTQGTTWLYGIAVTTPITALVVWRLLHPRGKMSRRK